METQCRYMHTREASVDMDISMDIHRKPVDMDMDMDGKFHIHGKPVGGGCPLVSEILDQRDLPASKKALSSLYSLVAPQA